MQSQEEVGVGHDRSKVAVGMIEIVYHIALQTTYNLRCSSVSEQLHSGSAMEDTQEHEIRQR